ncbi:glycine cleavage system protein R [Marinobacterium sp. LSUCC0821]|jgi:glycine cleavage system regulatory protein|uniref:glycine cleavage system protein R n=1 Tax=Marinobacterium sp. LSUCC0821 TaxID=2668067 RepID=UPI001451453D|nr:ACT domain-containing protein [Marinobacterium sp. LSUCC0821]QJD71625.1 ACT domain-containing protein [Marinobacterium sp. LSUCC0821]
MNTVVISFIADDKPGLVNLISTTVSQHDGNWLESSLSHLAGKFAGVVVVQISAEKAEALIGSLKALSDKGIRLNAEIASSGATEVEYRAATLDLIGHDKPGIVRDISNTLAQMGVNLAKLTTEITPGSMSSELLFKAQGQLQIPTTTDIHDLQDAIERLASDLMVDIEIE